MRRQRGPSRAMKGGSSSTRARSSSRTSARRQSGGWRSSSPTSASGSRGRSRPPSGKGKVIVQTQTLITPAEMLELAERLELVRRSFGTDSELLDAIAPATPDRVKALDPERTVFMATWYVGNPD